MLSKEFLVSDRSIASKMGGLHALCFFLFLLVFLSLNNMEIVVNVLSFYLEPAQMGGFVVSIFYLLITFFVGVILFGIHQV